MRLLTLISWPYVRRHALRTLLTTIGVVLGIAVFVGMHTANQHVLVAFSDTINRIAGKTDLQVTAGDAGFSEEVLERVQSAAAVQVAVPVIEAVVRPQLEGQGDLLILAVDMTGDRSLRDYDFDGDENEVLDDPLIFLAQPDSLIVSKELADRHRLGIGSKLMLETANGDRSFTIRGIMKPAGLATAFGGNLAVMDVYAAQRMFGRGRTFDRIDLAVKPGITPTDAAQELSRSLGPGFDVQAPASRGQQAQAMVAGYRTMVSLSSAFALFIGMFIIHNSFVTAVTQRRTEIGILRALGATRGQIRNLFLAESLVLGAIGSVAGVAIGMFIARGISGLFAQLLSELYAVTRPPASGEINVTVLVAAAALGLATSVVAALMPARQATRVQPIEALQQSATRAVTPTHLRWRLAMGLGLAGVAIVLLSLSGGRWLSYGGYILTVASALLLGPVLSHALVLLLRPALKRWLPVEGSLAGDSMLLAPRRTAGAVLPLMFSLALVVAFAGMATAAYQSIVQWLDTSMNPDLFVMPSQRLDIRTARFPSTMAGEIAAIEGVARVQMFRDVRVNFRDKPVMVAAIEMNSVRETSPSKPIAGDRDDMYAMAATGSGVIISDNLAQLQSLKLGDTVDLAAPYGTMRLPVVGVIADYTVQQGSVFVDRSVFTKLWRDDAVNDFRVFIAPGADAAVVRQRIIDRYAGQRHLFVLANEEARGYVLRIADRWFGMVNVQIGIAVLIAILGIVNALTVSIADRRRELGVLKAVGALRGQIRRTIWLEAVGVAVIGIVLGSLLGAVMLRYLLDIVQRDAIGMRLDYQFPAVTVALLVPVMIAAAFAAALWPSEAAVRGSLVEALEYE